MASLDVIVFTRNRHHILDRSIKSWSTLPYNFFLLDATETSYLGEIPKNIRYLHLPGLTYGSRALKASKLLEGDYSIICNDDECYVPSTVNKMINILEMDYLIQSIGGKVVGVFKYGTDIVGDLIYPNMRPLSLRNASKYDYLVEHFMKSRNVPIGGIFRLMRRSKMQLLLEVFSLVRYVKSPYVYQIIGEMVVVLMGPSQILNQVYWIRNFSNEIINDEKWDRTNSFSSWWVDSENEVLRNNIIEWICKTFDIDTGTLIRFMDELIDKLSVEDKKNISKIRSPLGRLLRIQKFKNFRFLIKRYTHNSKLPTPLETILLQQSFPIDLRVEVLDLAKNILK